MLDEPKKIAGSVYLVGAGPGDPDLITVKGLSLLRQAEVVLYDRLIPWALLSECRLDAERIHVGKTPGHSSVSQEQINRLLVDRAGGGKLVVRLKGGDPFVFGRGGEELEACRLAGIPCQIVPGVSSAVAAPASFGIPLTYREKSRHFLVLTAQSNGEGTHLNYAALATVDTLVILMGRSSLAEICQSLIEAGRPGSTPAACIESATTRNQRIACGSLQTIAALADQEGLRAPVVTIIGEVASLGDVACMAAQASTNAQDLAQVWNENSERARSSSG